MYVYSRGGPSPAPALRPSLIVNSVKYFGATSNTKVTWRLHIEMTEAKALRTFIRIYFLLKSELLSTNIKLTLHKTLIRGITTYAFPA
jgi:hypothetical protein